jgi:4-amino-4-deoxy-L-arabinose transferase-like glycosyltransferase
MAVTTEAGPAESGSRAGAVWREVAWVALWLAAGLALRLTYAEGLRPNFDETKYLDAAASLVKSGALPVAMSSRAISHPMLSIYPTAAGYWLGSGSVFAIRCGYVVLSGVGLLGLYGLARGLFGAPVAGLALMLGALDRHLINRACAFTPDGLYLSLVPCLMYLMLRCASGARGGWWLALGVMGGAACLTYETSVLLVPPFILFLFLRRRLGAALRNPAAWAAAACVALAVVLVLGAEPSGGASNLRYAGSMLGTAGITLRPLLLYLGDLLICLRDTAWVALGLGREAYLPDYLPCLWVAGLTYLICFLASLRQARKSERLFLILFVVGVCVPAALPRRHESWNNFWWASASLPPMLVLTSQALHSLVPRRVGRFLGRALVAVCVLLALPVVLGPKRTYAFLVPCAEKAYEARMCELISDPEAGPAYAGARQLTDDYLRAHPQSVVAWTYKASLAPTPDERLALIEHALALEPHNPYAAVVAADTLMRFGENKRAAELLRDQLARGQRSSFVLLLLSEVELRLGRPAVARERALDMIRRAPEDVNAYMLLFFAVDAMGRSEEAQEALDECSRWGASPETPYVDAASVFAHNGELEKARIYYEQARRLAPHLPKQPPWTKR